MTQEVAKAELRYMSTYVALLAEIQMRDIRAPGLKVWHCMPALANASEHSPDTRIGKNAELQLPATRQWLLLVEDETEKVLLSGMEYVYAKDL